MSEDALKRRAGFEDSKSSRLTHDVLFMEDLAIVLRTSRSTIERRRRAGTFPIPELPSIDERPRWSRHAVERYLASSSRVMMGSIVVKGKSFRGESTARIQRRVLAAPLTTSAR